ncbi:hypothetical protein At1D1108_50650 (plasmid) [Agrobacterium tumefaciens]|nr:hypothetical protein At1D1108_50650 [Agrobacterium tumefaciens]
MTETPLAHFRRHRFPAEIIAHAVWLYYRFPLSFRDVEDLLAERGIEVSFQTISEWAAKFGLKFAHQLRRRSRGQFADKWQLDEMVVVIKGKKYWLWRAVDANGYVLDALLQSRRNKRAALRLMRKLLRCQGIAPRVMVTDKLRSYSAAKAELMPGVEHRSHKGINNRAENSHLPVRRRERRMVALQVGPAMPTFRVYAWPDRQSFSSSPEIPDRRRPSPASRSRHLDLARNRFVD